jgi:hypothetical protein
MLHLIAKMAPGSHTLRLLSIPLCQDLLNYFCYSSEDHCLQHVCIVIYECISNHYNLQYLVLGIHMT